MVSKQTKQDAAKALTDHGVPFHIDYQDQTFDFSIGKLKLGTLVQISEQTADLTPFDNSTRETDVVLAMAHDAPIKARIIALAIINSKPISERPKRSLFDFKKQPFSPEFLDENELTEFFLKTLDSDETNRLTNIILKMMGITVFFQSTVSLKGIDLLTEASKTVTDQLTLSGEE